MGPGRPKRKRDTSPGPSDTRKKVKQPEPEQTDDDSEEGDDLFSVVEIVNQRKGKYLIHWEPGPRGALYKDTWEPREFITKDLVSIWERKSEIERKEIQKRAVQRGHKSQPRPRARKSAASPAVQTTPQPPRRSNRIPSSSQSVGAAKQLSQSSVEDSSPVVARRRSARKPASQRLASSPSVRESPRLQRRKQLIEDEDFYEDGDTSAQSSAPVRPVESSQRVIENSSKESSSQPAKLREEIEFEDSTPSASKDSQQKDQSSVDQTSRSNSTLQGTQDEGEVSSSQEIPNSTEGVESSQVAVIPDSQTVSGSATYVPSTQTLSNNQIQSPNRQASSGAASESSLSSQVGPKRRSSSREKAHHSRAGSRQQSTPGRLPLITETFGDTSEVGVEESPLQSYAPTPFGEDARTTQSSPIAQLNQRPQRLQSPPDFPPPLRPSRSDSALSRDSQFLLPQKPSIGLKTNYHQDLRARPIPHPSALPAAAASAASPSSQNPIDTFQNYLDLHERSATTHLSKNTLQEDITPTDPQPTFPDTDHASFNSHIPSVPASLNPRSIQSGQNTHLADDYSSNFDLIQALPPQAIMDTTQDMMDTTNQPDDTVLPSAENLPRLSSPILEGYDVPSSESEDRDGALTPHVGLQEYIIPLPLFPLARSEYRRIFNLAQKTLAQLEESPNDAHKDITDIVEKLHLLCTHFDLTLPIPEDDEASQKPLESWHGRSSTKFSFLIEFLPLMREQPMNILLVARPGKTHSMLSVMLRHLRIPTRNLASSEVTGDQTGLTVSIAGPDEFTLDMLSKSSTKLMIAVDSSTFGSAWYHEYNKPHVLDQWPRLVSLVTIKTIEHVERCLASSPIKTDSSRTLLSTLALLHEAGRLSPDPQTGERVNDRAVMISVEQMAQLLVAWVVGESEWYIPRLGSLDRYVLEHKIALPAFNNNNQNDLSQSQGSVGKKHGMDPSVEYSTKRIKLTPSPEDGGDVTHISDSVVLSQIAERDSTITKLKNMIGLLEIDLKKTTKAQHGIERVLRDSQNEVRLRKGDQKRTENELVKTRLELEQAREVNFKQAEKFTAEKVRNTELQQEIDSIKNRDLAPDQMDELKKLRSRLTTMDNNYNFIQERFRDAQTAAAQSRSEADELIAKLEKLEPLAQGQMTEARRISKQMAEAKERDAIEKLQLRVEGLEKQLQKKDLAIEALQRQRGGYGTRAGSVPRSPRVGAQGPGSRAASPLPGSRLNQMHL